MNTIIIVIILIILLSILIYKYFVKGGHGTYTEYKNRNDIFNKELTNIPNDNNNFIKAEYYKKNKNGRYSYDITMKYGFCEIIRILLQFLNISVISNCPELDNGKKLHQKNYNTIINEYIKTHLTKKCIITLESNENFSSKHWLKSLLSDLRNIATIKSKGTDFYKNNTFASIQCNYNNENDKTNGALIPYLTNWIAASPSGLEAREFIKESIANTIGMIKDHQELGHYYVYFHKFADKYDNIIDYPDTIEDIRANVNLNWNYKTIILYLFNIYTTFECQSPYGYNADKRYKNMWDDLLPKVALTFDKKRKIIIEIKLNNILSQCDDNDCQKYLSNPSNNTCYLVDGYAIF